MTDKDELLSNFETEESKIQSVPKKLTVLPLRDVVIYPYMIFPTLIGRTSTLKAVAEAVERDKFIFLTAQKSALVDDPTFDDIYTNGTTARILQVIRLPNNLLKVLVEGLFQSRIKRRYKTKEYLEAEIARTDVNYDESNSELGALIRHSTELFTEYVRNDNQIPADLISAYENIADPVQKLFFAAANVKAGLDRKQRILDSSDLKEQYFELSAMLTSEIEMLKLENEIDDKIHDTIQKTQKKYYIQEQIRALQNELGDEEELMPELQAIREMIEKADMPEQAKTKAEEEFERLRKTPTMSPEFSVNRTYLEWLTQLPWKQTTEDNFDISHVENILNEDHYDLEKPKERILEFIAVLNLSGKLRRQILCFVGPPGVGKTSLAKSIARALGRKFVRFSLGGVRDEAEIRGHRRTYIGAMPGKIIQSMKKAGTVNPVILLDEIDKMSMDFRGDPSSALLEVLDPEQNSNFNDHYVEVDYDLSNVLFITTANVRYDIPLPLLDRMEIIELNSYLETEKLEIAKRHIIPKLKEEIGLENLKIEFEDAAVQKIVRQYTRESGVRNLEREIASVFRKLTKEIVRDFYIKHKELTPGKVNGTGKKPSDKQDASQVEKTFLKDSATFKKSFGKKLFKIDESKIEDYLKAPKFKDINEELADKVGVATGLAWTSVGGEILPIEVTVMAGNERLTLTGKLGDVMKESAMAALSYIRSNASVLKIKDNFFKNKEIHLHVPEGAIPKDGPSAGIAIGLAMVSAATGKKLRGDLAMTGEITLRGNVLPIGGLKEKLLAAKRVGVKTVFVPKDNMRDVEDISDAVKNGLEIIPLSNLTEALNIAFRDWNAGDVVMKKGSK